MATGLPITYRPKRWRNVGIFALGFVGIGFGLFATPPGNTLFVYAIVAATCGLVVATAFSFHPRATYLTIDDTGIEFAHFYRRHVVRWGEVTGFRTATMGDLETVGWDYVPDHPRSRILRRMSTALSKVEGALPEAYGQKPAELAQLLNDLHGKYAKAGA